MWTQSWALLVRMQKAPVATGNYGSSSKMKNRITAWCSNSTFRYILKNLKQLWKTICAHPWLAAFFFFFATAKSQKSLLQPYTNGWEDKAWKLSTSKGCLILEDMTLKWNVPVTKGQILNYSTSSRHLEYQTHRDRKQNSGSQEQRGRDCSSVVLGLPNTVTL